MGALNICLLNSLCDGEITLSLSACGRWEGGGFLPSVSPMGVCSLPNESSGSQTPSVSDKTCQVLTQEQQGHKSVQHPRGYLGNTGAQPGGEHCRQRGLWPMSPPSQWQPCRGSPLSNLESVSCSLQRARWPPAKRTWKASRSCYQTFKQAKGSLVGNSGDSCGYQGRLNWDRNRGSWNQVLHFNPLSLHKQPEQIPLHSLWVWKVNETIY